MLPGSLREPKVGAAGAMAPGAAASSSEQPAAPNVGLGLATAVGFLPALTPVPVLGLASMVRAAVDGEGFPAIGEEDDGDKDDDEFECDEVGDGDGETDMELLPVLERLIEAMDPAAAEDQPLEERKKSFAEVQRKLEAWKSKAKDKRAASDRPTRSIVKKGRGLVPGSKNPDAGDGEAGSVAKRG